MCRYYPYFAIMMMVVINVVVAIIGEAYNRAQSQRYAYILISHVDIAYLLAS